jgi:hypothetical protein
MSLKSAKRIHGKVISLEIGSICGALLDDPKTLVPTTVASSRFHPERTSIVTWILKIYLKKGTGAIRKSMKPNQ